ncbi:MAG: hypothetical protein SGILL_007722 [Bacillariaceae sp.]
MSKMGPLESAAREAVAAVEAEAAAAESSQAERRSSQEAAATTSHVVQRSSSGISGSRCLALIPLRPASKKKTLEVKQLPIVLGRTNLAQWWYQSCDCQHYYCRLHCRPVAQNIGSLSKVMIQIDTTGKVFVVGKNPHLVTITPERKDQILRVNDILSIGRRDREPWMRFQVVKTGTNSTVAPSPSIKNSSSRNRNTNSASGEEPAKKKQKVLFTAGTAQAASATRSKDVQRSSSNMSSGISGADNKNGGKTGQQPQRQPSSPQKHPQQQVAAPSPARKSAPTQQAPAVQGNNPTNTNKASGKAANEQPHDAQLPEWITTTHAKRNRGARSTSSLSVAQQGTNSKQQQHQAIVARLTKAAVAANAGVAPDSAAVPPHAAAAAYYNNNHHPQAETNVAPQQQQPSRKRRRRAGGSSNNNNSSSLGNAGGGPRGIRSAEDLFNGSRPHYPQIHLVFQDYETSARLVKASQRDANVDMTRRQPRNNRIFISKPGEGPPPVNGRMSSRNTESGGEEGPEQLGLLSKNFAAALLGAAAPAPAFSNAHNHDDDGNNIPPVAMQPDGGVVVPVDAGGHRSAFAPEHPEHQGNTEMLDADNDQSLAAAVADGGGTRGRPRNDSATCRAALAKYTAEKEAAAAKKRESTTQAEGEETSEQRNSKPSSREGASGDANDSGDHEIGKPVGGEN